LSGIDFQTNVQIDIPIIFITGHGDIPMSVKAMKAGAVEFLTKPFREQELLDAVRIALDRDRKRREHDKSTHDLRIRFGRLSLREREVMTLVATGLMNRQVAAEIGICEVTVKVHRHNIMKKLGAKSLADLVRMADTLDQTKTNGPLERDPKTAFKAAGRIADRTIADQFPLRQVDAAIGTSLKCAPVSLSEKEPVRAAYDQGTQPTDDLLGSRHMKTVLSIFMALGALVATEVSAQAPASVVQSGRIFHPPSEAGKPPRAARAQVQRPLKRGALDARAEHVTAAAFDGNWSVAINTRSGACDPSYRFGLQIINGNVVHEGRAAGRVSADGSVQVSISSGDQRASGQGRLSRNYGTGVWRGYGSAGTCAGTWQAGRGG
jgi:DNA-binding CsgD family transcriptional regulator